MSIEVVYEEGDLLTPQQLLGRLQAKKCWLYKQTNRANQNRKHNPDPLPTIRMGRYLRFSWKEVSAWLNRRHVKIGKAA